MHTAQFDDKRKWRRQAREKRIYFYRQRTHDLNEQTNLNAPFAIVILLADILIGAKNCRILFSNAAAACVWVTSTYVTINENK